MMRAMVPEGESMVPSWLDRLIPHGLEVWLCAAGGLLLLAAVVVVRVMWVQMRKQMREGERERAMREELEAYARLDASLSPGASPKPLALRVCRAVAEKSAFHKVAMLVRDPEGTLYVAASAGMDDLTVDSLQSWGRGVVRREGGLGPGGPDEVTRPDRLGPGNFVVMMGPQDTYNDSGLDRGMQTPTGCRRMILTLFRGQTGIILGALAVCADSSLNERPGGVQRAMPPLETLAMKISRTLENASLNERLMRAEKLAGLGQLAGGVAHELNNPLTAVLGFAELIAETSSEIRVRKDAETIILEAKRMRETVQSLLQFWRPVAEQDEPVDVSALMAELAGACLEKLEQRGVKLVLQTGNSLPPVRGKRDRLRLMLEHLLNNAAQSIASAQERRRATDAVSTPSVTSALPQGVDAADLMPTIRLTASHDGITMHLIVSDTGPGFPEPGRAFDPFYTTRQPGSGSGLGLSICYGIAREHGGEITAFNLHPHGAAVVVELPLRRTIDETGGSGGVVKDAPPWGSGSWTRESGREFGPDRRRSREE